MKLFRLWAVAAIVSIIFSFAAVVFYYSTNGVNLFNPTLMKWMLIGGEKERISEKIFQLGVEISDYSSNAGIKDAIVFYGLEKTIDILPPKILYTVNNKMRLKILVIDSFNEIEGAPDVVKGGPGGGLYWPNANEIMTSEGHGLINAYQRTFLHEIGHAYHWTINNYSEDFFWEIREKEEAPTKYAKTDYLEDFAETFALYFLEPDFLKEKAPLRYEKMKEILQ